jgi:hypothetical protein
LGCVTLLVAARPGGIAIHLLGFSKALFSTKLMSLTPSVSLWKYFCWKFQTLPQQVLDHDGFVKTFVCWQLDWQLHILTTTFQTNM